MRLSLITRFHSGIVVASRSILALGFNCYRIVIRLEFHGTGIWISGLARLPVSFRGMDTFRGYEILILSRGCSRIMVVDDVTDGRMTSDET